MFDATELGDSVPRADSETREKTPYEKHGIDGEDSRNRLRWDEDATAADEMVARTGSSRVPWHGVAADDERWARVAVLATLRDTLERALERT